jgi:hypothetical protein
MLVLACADGAGSAEFSQEGSRLACLKVVEEAARFVNEGGSVAAMDDGTLPLWFEQAAENIAVQAELEQRKPRDYACTLLVAILDDSGSAFAQLGDGAIVTGHVDQAYAPVFWPQSGEYANTTYFITEPEHLNHIQVELRSAPVEEVALFTDGLQMLALRFDDQSAHSPFFFPMFQQLRRESPGEVDRLVAPLAEFLNSPPVNARTDDDKTLLLATRLETAAPDRSGHTVVGE